LISIRSLNLAHTNLLEDDLFVGECLEHIQGLAIAAETDWVEFGMRWLNSKQSTRIGLNVSLWSESTMGVCPGKGASLLRLMYLGFGKGLGHFFKLDAFSSSKNGSKPRTSLQCSPRALKWTWIGRSSCV
jgi:hypothetical protein